MSAKKKLNAANYLGALVVAGLMYGVTGSFVMFLVTLIGLLVASAIAGDIRR